MLTTPITTNLTNDPVPRRVDATSARASADLVGARGAFASPHASNHAQLEEQAGAALGRTHASELRLRGAATTLDSLRARSDLLVTQAQQRGSYGNWYVEDYKVRVRAGKHNRQLMDKQVLYVPSEVLRTPGDLEQVLLGLGEAKETRRAMLKDGTVADKLQEQQQQQQQLVSEPFYGGQPAHNDKRPANGLVCTLGDGGGCDAEVDGTGADGKGRPVRRRRQRREGGGGVRGAALRRGHAGACGADVAIGGGDRARWRGGQGLEP